MRFLPAILIASSLLGFSDGRADETSSVARELDRIDADYRRIVSATHDRSVHAAAGRMRRAAYRNLIATAADRGNLRPDDLHALGRCHEAIGDTDKAAAFYAKSLAESPSARPHIGLARLALPHDVKTAEHHFAKALALQADQADHPNQARFWFALANAHQRERNWSGAIPYLEKLLIETKEPAAPRAAEARAPVSHAAVQQQLDRARRFAAMTSKAAPALNVRHWAQGEPTELDGLQDKVVLVDFCAMWAEPSRGRCERLKTLHDKFADQGLEIVSVTLAYRHKYDNAEDQVVYEPGLSAAEEATALASFANKHKMPWRFGIIGRDTIAQYGVSTLPHTVAVDKQGNVAAILLSDDRAAADLEAIVADLLK